MSVTDTQLKPCSSLRRLFSAPHQLIMSHKCTQTLWDVHINKYTHRDTHIYTVCTRTQSEMDAHVPLTKTWKSILEGALHNMIFIYVISFPRSDHSKSVHGLKVAGIQSLLSLSLQWPLINTEAKCDCRDSKVGS